MQLIQNYGLFWRRELIPGQSLEQETTTVHTSEWPRGGSLLGVGVRKRRQGVVNFASQSGIYALYDDQFRLIYVGQAGRSKGRLYKRLRSHTRNVLSERWSRFSWFGLNPVVENGDGKLELADDQIEEDIHAKKHVVLDHIEAVLISVGEPFRNKQGGRFGPNVTHYRQYKGDFEKDEAVEKEEPEDDV